MSWKKLIFIFSISTFSKVRPVTSYPLSLGSCMPLLNHRNVLYKLFVFYVYNLQVNYVASKSTEKTTDSLLWKEFRIERQTETLLMWKVWTYDRYSPQQNVLAQLAVNVVVCSRRSSDTAHGMNLVTPSTESSSRTKTRAVIRYFFLRHLVLSPVNLISAF